MAASKPQKKDLTAASAPDTGDFHDIKTRSVQQMNGSANCLGVNLSELGAAILGIDKSDDVQLVIYNNGIWIQTDD